MFLLYEGPLVSFDNFDCSGQSGVARGRGSLMAQLAGLKPVTKPEETPAPAPTGPQAAAALRGQVQAAGEPAAPVSAMARMGIAEQPPREEQRRPTVTRRGVAGKTGGQP